MIEVKKMFRSMSSERHLSDGHSSSSPTGHGVTSSGLDSQESSWIGLLSVVSRPAFSFLQKYLPGRPQTATPSDKRASWFGGDLKTSFVEEENEFLRQLDDIMPLTQHPAPHLTYLQCQHDRSAGLLDPKGGSTLTWLTADSLQEIGIQSAEEMDLNVCQQTQSGYLSFARTFLSHIRFSSMLSQETKPTGGKDWLAEAVSSPVKSSGGKRRTWWGSFWGGEESSQKEFLSDLSWTEEGTLTDQLCPHQPLADTKAPAVETTDAFVQSSGTGWMLGENTGPTDHKEESVNNGGLQTVQNREGSRPDHRLSIRSHLSSSEAAAACSEVALLTPDQDNGYSSLEEEHFQMCHQYSMKSPSEEQETEPSDACANTSTEMKAETSDENESTSGEEDEEERMREDEEVHEAAAQGGQSVEVTVLATPQCQNKAIAFIMGCPCSDDDSSQSDRESSGDDDGFDSEGSSDLSDLSDEDSDSESESDSDSEEDSEAERLWSSLCQSADPYNPQNFTARLHTRSTPPRSIPTSSPPTSTQSTPASSPDVTPLPLSSTLLTCSPPSGSDVWDDSTSASEADEAESLHLWNSFTSFSDPYSPFNFQAPLRTRGPTKAGPRLRAKKGSQSATHSPHHGLASPPEYRKEEAEERLDSGFSEPSTSSSTHSSRTTKKVRFCDDVEEFFASCGEEEEDRRGPWEEFARDRCRFLRRCQEVEQSIAYCLQPQHRSLVYQRLSVLCSQDA